MIGVEESVIGRRYFEVVDVTDPCYDRDVWCRMNDVEVCPGEYECVVVTSDEGEFGTRVAKIGIYLDGAVPDESDMHYLDSIGVDSGLAGFFERKEDYSTDEWCAFCDAFGRKKAMQLHNGFCSESGYGDGGYNVYMHATDGGIDALEIRFIITDDRDL